MNQTIEIDSLIANEFTVTINGEPIRGIFRVANLVTLAFDDDGNRIYPPFEITKMVQRDGENTFNTWLRETIAMTDNQNLPTREVTVVAVDDGVVTRRWIARGARIVNVRYTEFDTGRSEMVEEIYTIAYDHIDEEWPTTDS